MIKVGGNEITDVKLGSTQVNKVYVGSDLVWQKSTPIPYVDWIKSLGCVVWLPLTENDLEDKISEVSLSMSGKGSMTWDSTYSMYKIAVPSSGSNGTYVAKLDNGFSKNLFPNDTFTVIGTFRKVTSNASYYYNQQPCMIVSASGDTANSIAVATYSGTSKSTTIPSGTHNYAKTLKSDERKFYYDGTLEQTYAGYAGQLPSNWSASSSGIIFGRKDSVVTYYIKDYYIFKTYLPLSTIRQIQGYDPLPSNVIR